jgi:hypothetical protein
MGYMEDELAQRWVLESIVEAVGFGDRNCCEEDLYPANGL